MKILVTGASGFIGSALVRHLHAEPVHYRTPTKLDADVILHCGHDFATGGALRNLELARGLLSAPRVIYFSSCSATPGARSEYGRAKRAVEDLFLQAGHTVIRPGLVIGAGGLFLRMAERLRQSRLVPLVNGGRLLVPVVALNDLLSATARLLKQAAPREWNLFLPALVSQRELVAAVQPSARILPLPAALALRGLRLARAARLALPVGEENLLGILDSQVLPWSSDLLELVPRPLELRAMVKEAFGTHP